MRDLLLNLLARRRCRLPNDAEPETELIPAALERQVQAAYPRPAVSDALRMRVMRAKDVLRKALGEMP